MANLENRLKAFVKRNDYFRKAEIKMPSIETYLAAKVLVERMQLITKQDYLLFLSSLVVLSAKNKDYKRNKSNTAYSFKEAVATAIESAIFYDKDFLKFDMKRDLKNIPIVYVEIAGLQFSFHNVPITETMLKAKEEGIKQYENLEWEKIPFQRDAEKMFNYALSQENLSNIAIDGSFEHPNNFVTRHKRMFKRYIALASQALANNDIQANEDMFLDNNNKMFVFTLNNIKDELNNEIIKE